MLSKEELELEKSYEELERKKYWKYIILAIMFKLLFIASIIVMAVTDINKILMGFIVYAFADFWLSNFVEAHGWWKELKETREKIYKLEYEIVIAEEEERT